VRPFIAEIDRAGVRAASLVRQILGFARPQQSVREVLPLGPVVDEALKLLRATVPTLIEIRTSWDANAPPVSVDAGQVHQAIVNLVTNAADAIGSRPGRIDLAIQAAELGTRRPDHPRAQGEPVHPVTVADDGSGMDRATRNRVFDPFFTTKASGKGTGLGLSIVHGIMRSHDGAVTISSRPGHGTTVDLYFPAAELPEARPKREPGIATERSRTERLLFVDDDEALVELMRTLLSRLGYRVTAFNDPWRPWRSSGRGPRPSTG